MKTILVVYTVLEVTVYQKRYAFNTASVVKVGDMIKSPLYDTPMKIVKILPKGYKYFNKLTGELSNTFTNAYQYELRELEIVSNKRNIVQAIKM